MSTEIEEKEREFENEQEHINNINRAKTKMPNQNRVTNNIPSTINDDEDQEYRLDDDHESFDKREKLEAIMEIGKHENQTENQDDDVVSHNNVTTTMEEHLLYNQ